MKGIIFFADLAFGSGFLAIATKACSEGYFAGAALAAMLAAMCHRDASHRAP